MSAKNLKAALCPSCGGKLQLPDDVKIATCTYCGVMVTVQEAFRLASRVRDFTAAKPLESVREYTFFDTEAAKQQNRTILVLFSIAGLFLSILLGSSDRIFGIVLATVFLIFAPIIYLIRNNNLSKIIEADREMAKKGPTITVTGYEGQCPYCDMSVVLKANVTGDNCPACTKRIVIRDSKFYSVDTPVADVTRTAKY